jgi:EAL domain-containing protein (putative c-di-GMP-specific phosphodiesterase class I)
MRRFPVDTLKVDQSFVRDVTNDSANAGVVGALIQMGRSLHMRVVAEGVETKDQLTFLRGKACAEAQGHYFGRPLQAEDFSELMRRYRSAVSA